MSSNDVFQLYTRSEIEKKFSSILEDMGVKGEILDIMSAIGVETIFLTQLNAAAALKEANILTARHLESVLAICYENFTRVERGYCQRVELQDLICLKTHQVKAFTKVNTKGNHTYFYVEDGSYNQNETGINLKLIVGKEVVSYDNEGDIDRRLYSNNYILEVPGDGWSEDFIIYRDETKLYNIMDIPVDQHSDEKYSGNMYTTEIKRLSVQCPYYIATTPPNYGIRIFGYKRFNKNNKFTFKGIKLLDAGVPDLDPKKITNLPNMLFKNNKVDESIYNNSPSVREDSDITKLILKTAANFRDRNYISSKNGLLNIIELELQDFFKGSTVNIINGEIVITYILKDGQVLDAVTQKNFIEHLIFNYKITETIKFEEAPVKDVRLFLKVYYNNTLDQLEVYKIINSFEDQVGGVYSIDQVKSKISKLETVSHVEYIDPVKGDGFDYTYCTYRPDKKDELVKLEEEVEQLENPQLPESETNKKVKIKKIYRLKFDKEGNKTNNSFPGGVTNGSNFLILFSSNLQDVL